jgi:hypothetical protein
MTFQDAIGDMSYDRKATYHARRIRRLCLEEDAGGKADLPEDALRPELPQKRFFSRCLQTGKASEISKVVEALVFEHDRGGEKQMQVSTKRPPPPHFTAIHVDEVGAGGKSGQEGTLSDERK